MSNLRIHRAVWKDERKFLEAELKNKEYSEEKKKEIFNEKDWKGNTPLILAIYLKREKVVELFLDHDDIVDVSIANDRGFRAFDVALYISNEAIIRSVAYSTTKYVHNSWEKRMKPVLEKLSELKDMEGCLKWSFRSFVPFLSRLLPSDEYRFYKRGHALRVDSTLSEFEGVKWHRGSLSYLYTGDEDPEYPNELVMIDRDRKEVYRMLQKEILPPSEDEMREWLSYKTVSETDIISSQMLFEQKLNWWWGPKKDQVSGKWDSKEFEMSGLIIKFINTVYPHLSHYKKEIGFDILLEEAEDDADLAKMKAEAFGKIITDRDKERREKKVGGANNGSEPDVDEGIANEEEKQEEEVEGDRVEVFGYTYDQYFGAHEEVKVEGHVNKGVSPDVLEQKNAPEDQRMLFTHSESTSKKMSANVWFSKDFPVSASDIFLIARKVSPTDAIIHRIENIEKMMPLEEGFPVKIEFPIFGAALTGSAEFSECVLCDVDEDLVKIPKDYEWKQERLSHAEYERSMEDGAVKE